MSLLFTIFLFLIATFTPNLKCKLLNLVTKKNVFNSSAIFAVDFLPAKYIILNEFYKNLRTV